jgi:hypothetical protein
VIRRRQQIALPTLPTLHHNDTGPSEDSNALTISPAGWRILPPSGIISTSGIAALAHAIVTPILPPATALPTTSDLVPPTIRRLSTTLLPALHLQHAQQTSTADVSGGTTATGRLFTTDKSCKRWFLNDTGSHRCVPSQAHPTAQVAHSLRPLHGKRHYHPHLRMTAS